jgi:tetratricopeptide (TPR) repeat protein
MTTLAAPETVDRTGRVSEIDSSVDAYWLGKCAEAFGDPELALAYHRRALDTATTPRECARRRATLGAALCRQGALDESLAVLLESIELDPSFDTNRESYTALLELRRRRGELRKALDLARAMVPTLCHDPPFARSFESLLHAIDGVDGGDATARSPGEDPFAALRARIAARRSGANALERHLRALAEPV